ncbi:MAG: haloalkane dehalogenase [Actinomycetota bacterium]
MRRPLHGHHRPAVIRRIAIALVGALVAVGCSSDASDDEAGATSSPGTAPSDTAVEDDAAAGVDQDAASDDTADPDEPATDDDDADSDGAASSGDSAACDAEPTVLTTDAGVDFVRTPDACFDDLPDWPYSAQYVEIDGLRQGYVDEGPGDGDVMLLLHGQPSWSYLYRDMVPVFVDAGYRVIAMDHLGMGRSDKPTEIESYSYLGHGDRLERFIGALDLTDINLFVQDWGSLIGLRVAGENTDLFATITVGNGNLPVVPDGAIPFPEVENPDETRDLVAPFADIPDQQVPFYDGCELLDPNGADFFPERMEYSMTAADYTAGSAVEALTWFDLSDDVEAAYDAPFPRREYMAGTRVFPSLVLEVDGVNDEAWAGLQSFDRPFLTLWGANDAGSLGSCQAQQNLVANVPGAQGQPHDRLPEAGHFLQSDQGVEIATRMVDWLGGLSTESGAGSSAQEQAAPEDAGPEGGMVVVNELTPSTPEQLAGLQEPGPDGPVYMVNLLEFKDVAEYADGRETDLTGEEAYAIYEAGVAELITQFGGEVEFEGEVTFLTIGQVGELWDAVGIARYPSRTALLQMSSSPEFAEISVHRTAGLAGQLNIETIDPAT